MSIGFPFSDPRVKPLDSNGLPQAGCYYCFFLTGTLTAANVYADGALSTPLSQPTPGSVNPTGGTVADSAGRFVVMYLDPTVTYRAQLYSAAGILLEDTDPYKVPGSPNVSFGNGTAAAPGIAFSNFLSTGLYVPSSNSLGFATNGLAAGSISQNQAWSLPAANGAATFTSAGASGFYAGVFNGNATSAESFGLQINAGTTSADVALLVQNQAAGATFLQVNGDGSGQLGPNSTNKLSWSTAGAFVMSAPTSGTTLDILGAANANALLLTANSTSGQAFGARLLGGTTSADWGLRVDNQANSQNLLLVQGDGQTYVAAPTAASAGPSGTFQVGYIDEPQRIVTVNSSFGLSDRGKQIYLTSGSNGNMTIPANSSVAFPIGSIMRVINQSPTAWQILITTDTLIWLPSGSGGAGGAGARSLAVNGACTIEKVTATQWVISGVGLS